MRFLSLNFLFCYLFLFAHYVFGQFKGGNGDGHNQTITSNSLLDGVNPTFIFSGGNGEGFDQEIANNLLLNTASLILFSGGNADGHSQKISTNSLLNGANPAFIFSGGNGEGFDQEIANNLLLNTASSILFSGGSADGHSQKIATSSLLDGSISTFVFSGGNSDGHDQIISTNSLLNGVNPTFVFSGGNADGSDQLKIEQIFLNNGDPSILFSGGHADGADQLAIEQRFLNNGDPTILFMGGVADGTDQLKIEQVFLDNGDPSILFVGGNADGSDELVTAFSLLNGISPTFIFAGGDGDGHGDLAEPYGTLNGTHRPGSGTAIDFNGTNQYVTIGDDTSLDLDDGTIEFWFKPDWTAGTLGYTPVVVSKWTSIGPKRRYSIAVTDDMDGIGLRNGSSFGTVSYTFTQGEWYHVAFREDGSDTRVFVNGIAQGFTGNAFSTDTGAPFNIGSNNGSNPFPGEIDEVRVWSAILTIPELRAWMSKKITSSHPQYASLEGYWRFDEGNESATKNGIGGNNGTLINSPTWTMSGAMIGDESVYDFTSPTSLSLNVTNAGQLSVAITGGTADGIQIYYIGEAPSDVTPPGGFINLDNKYFGVFVTGTSPVYTVTYDYSGNTEVNNENAIQLAFRSNNADTWTDLSGTVNTTSNTITKTGLTGTEFILGGTTDVALPITLLNFAADVVDNYQVLLNWRTATEINNDYFQLYHSVDGVIFEELAKIPGGGDSNDLLEYQYLHKWPNKGINYYRLIQHDYDGVSEILNTISVQIHPQNMSVTIYPNPTSAELFVSMKGFEEPTIELVDLLGRRYKPDSERYQNSKYVIHTNNLHPGIYTLAITTMTKTIHRRIIIE